MPQITLLSATVVRFADNAGALPDDTPGLDYLFSLGYGFRQDPCEVAVRALVAAVPGLAPGEPEPAEPTDPAAEVEVECVFGLDSIDEFLDDAGEVRVPRPFLAHLTGMTVSTARGVFIGAGRSPLLQRAPLPVGAPLYIIDQFVDPETYPWVEATPAVPPPQAD